MNTRLNMRGTSYRTKRRKIQKELDYLDTSEYNETPSSSKNFEPSELFNRELLNDVCEIEENNSFLKLPVLDDHLLKNKTSTFEVQCPNLSNSVEYNINDSTIIDPPNNYQDSMQDIIKQKLGKWSIDFNIPQNAVNALLKLLKSDANMTFLPKDCRTLLNSRSSTLLNIHDMVPGNYYHFGLATGIVRFASTFPLEDIIRLAIGIDGLTLSKSSASQFWPILAYI